MFWMKGLMLLLVISLSGCGHVRIDYEPRSGITKQEAVSIIEQVFSEDFGEKRPQGVYVTDQYIVLADGIVSRGTGYGSAVPVGSGAIAVGTSTVVTQEIGQRIYFNSLGDSTLHTKRARNNRYVVLVRNTEGAVQRSVNTTSLRKAERFIDALGYFRRNGG